MTQENVEKVRLTPYRNSSKKLNQVFQERQHKITRNKADVGVVVVMKVQFRQTTALFLEHECTQQRCVDLNNFILLHFSNMGTR
jgi:hypothetical protein